MNNINNLQAVEPKSFVSNFLATNPNEILHCLSNDKGVVVQVTNFGARIVSALTPDRNGVLDDIVLGFDHINKYVNFKGERFHGCTVGRYANRIANGQFEIDGAKYSLPINNGPNSLHGGLKGLDSIFWNVESSSCNSIVYSHTSADGEEGYPGILDVLVEYTLTDDNELMINFSYISDKKSIVNLTNHAYFNLKGEGDATITDHILKINADRYCPINENCIPFGELANVENTPFDFRDAKVVSKDIDANDVQIANGAGYDHSFEVKGYKEGVLTSAAFVSEETTGRTLEVLSTYPAIQFYAGNWFDGTDTGKSGRPYTKRCGLALEAQFYPDSPNQKQFPSPIVEANEEYRHTIVYKFGVL